MTHDPPPLGLLIVEDEPLVLAEIARGLARHGNPVLTARCAAEALAILGARDDIGVVLTDMRMPGEDGLTLAERLRGLLRGRRAAEMLLVTGHATLISATAAVRAGVADLIQKPFRLPTLRAAVRRAMARASERRGKAAALAEAQATAGAWQETDPLTGLANAAGLQAAMAAAAEDPATGLVRLDLHRLHEVAAQFGRVAADGLLLAVAARVQAATRPDDLVARLSDRDFAVLRPHTTRAGLQQLADRLLAEATAPLLLGGTELPMAASVGAALSGDVLEDSLLASAVAMLTVSRRSGAAELFLPARHAGLLRDAMPGHDLPRYA